MKRANRAATAEDRHEKPPVIGSHGERGREGVEIVSHNDHVYARHVAPRGRRALAPRMPSRQTVGRSAATWAQPAISACSIFVTAAVRI
jgi:hypothetical protein